MTDIRGVGKIGVLVSGATVSSIRIFEATSHGPLALILGVFGLPMYPNARRGNEFDAGIDSTFGLEGPDATRIVVGIRVT